MDSDYFKDTLEAVLYSLKIIVRAAAIKNLNEVEAVATQEIKAIEYDLKNLEGGKK